MRTDHIKSRKLVKQVILAFITLGIYAIYWYYVTLKELHIANGNEQGVAMWTLMGIIPIANYFSNWHYSAEFEQFIGPKYPTLVVFLAFLVFFPIVWFIVQTELNKAADTPAWG